MQIERRLSAARAGAYKGIGFRRFASEIADSEAGVESIEAPTRWSLSAMQALAQAGFRRRDVPSRIRRIPEADVPEFLWRGVPADDADFGDETSARQLFDRLAGAWAYHGWKGGYFATEADVRAYHDEIRRMMAAQIAMPDAEQLAGVGLGWAYGIEDPARGRFAVDHVDGTLRECAGNDARPAPEPAVARGDTRLRFDDGCAGWDTGAGAAPLRDTATLNLLRFCKDGAFDTVGFAHATRLWLLTLEIGVMMARSDTAAQARRHHDLRPLALGHANLAGLLMAMGLGYDSDAGRAVATAVTAIMTGTGYAVSAEIAAEIGGFAAQDLRADAMLRVIRNHRRAAHGHRDGYEGLALAPVAFDRQSCPDPALARGAAEAWDRALELGTRHGFRNAAVSQIRNCGVAALILGCDAPGIEPEVALIRHRMLADGSQFRTVNRTVAAALEALGYTPSQVAGIVGHVAGYGSLTTSPALHHAALAAYGFGAAEIDALEAALRQAEDIRHVFNQWTLGAGFCTGTLGIPRARLADHGFDLLRHLGVGAATIDAANAHVCGHRSLEGAPDLDPAHLPVFAGATAAVDARVAMAAAVQGVVSADLEARTPLPAAVAPAEIARIEALGRGLGLRAMLLRRDAVTAPPQRSGLVHSALVDGVRVELCTTEGRDGRLSEIAIELPDGPAATAALLNGAAAAVTFGLQNGAALAGFVEAHRLASEARDRASASAAILDLVFRELARRYEAAPADRSRHVDEMLQQIGATGTLGWHLEQVLRGTGPRCGRCGGTGCDGCA